MASEPKSEPKFPFARARVERIIQGQCPEAEVSPRVRLAMNRWLGEMTERVAKDFAKVPHTIITERDFQDIIGKYDFTGNLNEERERIMERMTHLKNQVDAFRERVDASVILKEEGPQDLIFGRIQDQYVQDYEEAVYVSEHPEVEEEGTA